MLCKHQASEHIYYQEKSDSIYIIGRESSLHKVIYLTPEPIIKFPFNYGDTITQYLGWSDGEEIGKVFSIIANANVQIELEKKKAMDDLKQEVVAIATMMAGKVVAASIDEKQLENVNEQRTEKTNNIQIHFFNCIKTLVHF